MTSFCLVHARNKEGLLNKDSISTLLLQCTQAQGCTFKASSVRVLNCVSKRHTPLKIFQCAGTYTANIFNVIFTLFTCVPLSTVISLYCLHLIAAPSTVDFYCNFYIRLYMANTCKVYTFYKCMREWNIGNENC